MMVDEKIRFVSEQEVRSCISALHYAEQDSSARAEQNSTKIFTSMLARVRTGRKAGRLHNVRHFGRFHNSTELLPFERVYPIKSPTTSPPKCAKRFTPTPILNRKKNAE